MLLFFATAKEPTDALPDVSRPAKARKLFALPRFFGRENSGSIWVWVAPPILVYFSGDWDVHWGYALLTHGHMGVSQN